MKILKFLGNNIVGFRSRKVWKIGVALSYYILTLLLSVAVEKFFIFPLFFLWSIPFCVFAVIDTIKRNEPLRLVTLPVCFVTLLFLTFVNGFFTEPTNTVSNEQPPIESPLPSEEPEAEPTPTPEEQEPTEKPTPTPTPTATPTPAPLATPTPTPEATATPTAAPQTNSDDTTDNIVYVGKTGTKYHYASCSTLKGNGRPIDYDEAISRGYTACKRCY